MGEVWTLLKAVAIGHTGAILVFVLVVAAWKMGGFERISTAVGKAEAYWDRLRETLERKKVRQIAKTVFDWVDDEARQLAKKTDTDKDDKFVEKLAWGLKKGLALLERAGLNGEGSEDELKALFGEFHEAERKAKELASAIPLGLKPEESDSEC